MELRRRALILLAGVAVSCAHRTASPAPSAAPAAVIPAVSTPVEESATLETAVLVTASSEREGIAWENDWIFRRYGRFRKKSVALASQNGRHYDVITVDLADHSQRVLYFDITEFFGK